MFAKAVMVAHSKLIRLIVDQSRTIVELKVQAWDTFLGRLPLETTKGLTAGIGSRYTATT